MNKIRNSMLLATLVSLLAASPAVADHPDRNTEIENLKKRIETLEAEQAGETAAAKPFSLFSTGKYLTLSGLLELEAGYTDIAGMEAESDLSLATAEFSAEARINDHVGGHVVFLYEEDDPDDETVKLDEAVLILRCPRQLLHQIPAFYGGRLYLPFGTFNSTMITDPLTLELGESNDTAALVALEGDLWNLSLGVFNGSTDAAGDNDHLDSLVAALRIAPREYLSFGLSYISDLAESDNGLVADPSLYQDSVAGAAASVAAAIGRFGLEAEILGALDDFAAGLIGNSDLSGERPLAWNLEASWQATDDLLLTGRYEQASDFQDDVVRTGVSVSYGLFANTVFALEYLHAEPDTDPHSDTLTAQLALTF